MRTISCIRARRRIPSLPRATPGAQSRLDPGHTCRRNTCLTSRALQVWSSTHHFGVCWFCATKEREVILEWVARRSTVYEIWLELTTRRSLVRIQSPLPESTVDRQGPVPVLSWRSLVLGTRIKEGLRTNRRSRRLWVSGAVVGFFQCKAAAGLSPLRR